MLGCSVPVPDTCTQDVTDQERERGGGEGGRGEGDTYRLTEKQTDRHRELMSFTSMRTIEVMV